MKFSLRDEYFRGTTLFDRLIQLVWFEYKKIASWKTKRRIIIRVTTLIDSKYYPLFPLRQDYPLLISFKTFTTISKALFTPDINTRLPPSPALYKISLSYFLFQRLLIYFLICLYNKSYFLSCQHKLSEIFKISLYFLNIIY